jgi:dihydroorotate dehydrogenase
VRDLLFALARPGLHALSAEDAHEATLRALEGGLGRLYPPAADDPVLATRVLGLDFANPIGLAAGFDKDARVVDPILRLGFGFTEIGTVTPLPQPGNPRPRVFRLRAEAAVINRFGFNSAGHAATAARLTARHGRPGLVGVNIGANKEAADRIADYVKGYETFAPLASYVTVNISSPNTPGLRDLQALSALEALLGRLAETRTRLAGAGARTPPIVVKIAPDIAEADLAATARAIESHGMDAIAVSNTTLSRAGLTDVHRTETGGMSGRPLFNRATAVLARVYEATGGRIPLIGIGGIDSGEAAIAKLEAGASLVQLYTALVYQGPGLVRDIKAALVEETRKRGLASVGALTGAKAAEWAARPIEG